MKREATFSKDGKKRFDLIRDWRDEIGSPDKTVLFAGLNPSKAGADKDDPSVRKMIGFARRWGFGRLVVVNLNPIVCTDPWDLPPWYGIDVENRAITRQWMGEADLVVAAWGNQPAAICRTIALPELVHLFWRIAPVSLSCIGRTKGGAPLHPSRARYTLGPERFEQPLPITPEIERPAP